MIPYQRNQAQVLENLLEMFPVVAILGARQTGKTTLAKMVRPDWSYYDLEQPQDYDLISQDPELFFQHHSGGTIIDEAQNCPLLFQVLRGVIDADRGRKGRFILTGSSSPELSRHLSESLAGRIAIIELGTLKVNEYYRKPLSDFYQIFANKITAEAITNFKPQFSNEEVQHVWLKGGYPEPALSNSELFYQQWMSNYYLNYVNRDIARLFPKLNKVKYQRFIRMLGHLSGTILNKTDLGRALEISEGTAREYLQIAEGTFLWRELLSYENSNIKSIVKMPKGYVRDSGLLHYFLQINTQEDLYNHPILGHSFEGFVIEELIKGLRATMLTNWKVDYFRTRKGVEIDAILTGYFGVLPIEIKYSSSVSIKKLRALTEFVEQHQLPLGIVISCTDKVTWLSDKIVQIPVGML